MADSHRNRYSRSPSPRKVRSRSQSRSRSRSRSMSPPRYRSRSRSRSRSESRSRVERDESNPGNTLFVTGLSSRVTERELEDFFSREGKVSSVFLVVEPRTRVSRGFAFVTMSSVEDADRCVKYLNQSVLEGRYITVEKSRRKRPRTPTPGHYLGIGTSRRRYRGGYGRDDYAHRRSPRRSPYRGGRGYSPRRSPYAERSRRYRSRSYSPYGSPDRGYGRRSGVYAR
ncbi:unnamed protein product [Amaranthus hypochondriacus]